MAEKKADQQSRMKKFLKGPWLWIAIALSVVFIGTSLMNTEQYTKVDTQVGLEMIRSGSAEKVTIFDGDQRVDVVLRNPDAEFGDKVQFYFVSGRAEVVA
ncbi:MAG: ATP-dependent metallopeptidase FtsH/Yme1/Tma family protein, partial [Aquiluna sp.]